MSNEPVARIRDERGLSISIFKNVSGEGRVFFSTPGIESRYFDKKSEEWKSTSRLSDSDWPVAALLLQEATRKLWELRAEAKEADGDRDGPEAVAG